MLMTQILVLSSNKLDIYNFLVELRCIHRLERVSISRKLQFKKASIMLKDQSPKFKGAICNVPIDVVSTCNTLPCLASINGLAICKLKKKLEYRGHVCEGSVPVPFRHVCEELSHPHLFLYGKYGFQIKRQIPLSPTKYFNQRLLNYTHKFSSDCGYIFFAHKVIQSVNLHNRINIDMRKVTSDKLTTCMLDTVICKLDWKDF